MSFPAVELSLEDLAKRVGAKPSEAIEGGVLDQVHDAALELLIDAATVTFRPIPPSVAEEMLVRVVRALWDARRTTHGAQLTTLDAEAAPRAPRDPLAPVGPMLARYVVPL